MVDAPLPTQIDGFDANGIFVGSAVWNFPGGWFIRIGKDSTYVREIENARRILRESGAVKLQEGEIR